MTPTYCCRAGAPAAALARSGVVAPSAYAEPVVPSVAVAPVRLTLADSARVTLALEGPAPLRVETLGTADALLAASSATVWHIRPVGAAAVTSLAEGRERWAQGFRLDPYTAGAAVPLDFNPIRVRAGHARDAQVVTWPARTLRVDSTLRSAKPDDVREGTSVEEVPPPPAPTAGDGGWAVLCILWAVFASVLVGVVARRWLSPPRRPTPKQWAERELDSITRDLATSRRTAAVVAERSAEIVREYLERRYAVPASRLTTAELLAACDAAGFGGDALLILRDCLQLIDAVKFADRTPSADSMAALVSRVRRWIRSSGDGGGNP